MGFLWYICFAEIFLYFVGFCLFVFFLVWIVVGCFGAGDQPNVKAFGLLRYFLSLCLFLGMCSAYLTSPTHICYSVSRKTWLAV